eukprot:356435-Chlamydomonas_euryale.AAC.1
MPDTKSSSGRSDITVRARRAARGRGKRTHAAGAGGGVAIGGRLGATGLGRHRQEENHSGRSGGRPSQLAFLVPIGCAELPPRLLGPCVTDGPSERRGCRRNARGTARALALRWFCVARSGNPAPTPLDDSADVIDPSGVQGG